MNNLNIISTTEFAELCPEVDTSKYAATTVSGFISAASQSVADYLNYSPYAEDIVAELKEARVTSDGDLLIFPRKVPVQSVSSIAIMKGTVELPITLTNGAGSNIYNIDYTKRNIRIPSLEVVLTGFPVITNFYALRGQQFYIKMSYRAGFEVNELPQTIKMATTLFVRDMIGRSVNTTGATSISQGGISMSFAQRDGESDLVKDAKRLLNPYRRV